MLETMRHVGDPVADETIAEIFAAGSIGSVNRVMRTLVDNDDFPTASLPDAVRRYMESTSALPHWAEPELLAEGSLFFARYGPEIVLCLFAASLPILYAGFPGCEILGATARMTGNLQRRVVETGQFVIDVTDAHAFTPEGRGVLTSQKVRLMHAAIRHYLLHDERCRGSWCDEWDVPICQTDLAATMLTFSVTVLDALERAGISLTDREREGYLHSTGPGASSVFR